MKHVELHAHYLRQLVQEKVVTLFYYKTDDHIADIFTNPLSEFKFIKLYALCSGFHVTAIMGGCPVEIISPPEPP
jgi:hypothetical protein